MTAYLLLAETSAGQTIRRRWTVGENLKAARKRFWGRLPGHARDAIASIEELDSKPV